MTRHLARLSVIALASAAAGLFMPSSPALADPLAVIAGETLDVKADQLDVDIEKGTATLTGNVTAVMGELSVACPKVEIKYDEAPKVRWARGTGGVNANIKGIIAKAASVEVDVAKRSVKLVGAVRLSRGKGWVEAERAVVDIATRKVTLHEVKGSIPVEPPAR
jgi:lipopolysaccharide transport protein LptA